MNSLKIHLYASWYFLAFCTSFSNVFKSLFLNSLQRNLRIVHNVPQSAGQNGKRNHCHTGALSIVALFPRWRPKAIGTEYPETHPLQIFYGSPRRVSTGHFMIGDVSGHQGDNRRCVGRDKMSVSNISSLLRQQRSELLWLFTFVLFSRRPRVFDTEIFTGMCSPYRLTFVAWA